MRKLTGAIKSFQYFEIEFKCTLMKKLITLDN